ncbi:putative G2/M phase-specific E3 ubiquitin-protein ligase-like isoform X1 [Apostichopus japonicus]|uniref:HECT-type E3 ubiquitin transferase n=1 Tax=Stichopus japonicus TaxID=307972 RepID=A0A2G8K5D7_STIJA|nr:putative G2/M phase-specific E3 ubiquitin-protein ligase-like isoform X1 [Apostichopus japonicus]
MPSFALTTSTAKSHGGNQMPGPSTSTSEVSLNSADKYLSDYISIMEPIEDDESDEDIKAVMEESVRDLDSTSDNVAMEAKMQQVIKRFQVKKETSEKLTVVIRRKKILRSATEVVKQSVFSFLNEPVIHFSGEDAVDLGGPKREFFTLLTQQLSNLGVFEGKEGRLYFSHDISLLEKGKYKLVGSFVAWSILHGGPGFSRLHPTLYDMMVGRKTEEDIQIDDVIDGDVSSRLNMIKNATSDRMVADAIATMGDWAANNGCSGIYTMTLETKTKYVPSSNSICFTVLKFLNLKKLFKPNWSEGTLDLEQEEDSIYCFEQFLMRCEAGQCGTDVIHDDGSTSHAIIGLHHILRFCTGADAIPPMDSPSALMCLFLLPQRRKKFKAYPTAHTCGLELHLPRGLNDIDYIVDLMVEAILCYPGFGKI